MSIALRAGLLIAIASCLVLIPLMGHAASLSQGDFYRDTVLADGPIIYWRLGEADKSAGNTAVNLGSLGASGDGVYRNVVGNVVDTRVPDNTGASFGTTNASGSTGDRVQTSLSGTFPTTALSLEAWVRSDATGGDPTIFNWAGAPGGAGNDVIFIEQGDQWRLFIDGTAQDTGIPRGDLTDGEWHHLVVTWDADDRAAVFVDGALEFELADFQDTAVLNPDGSFVLAQEQDSIDGGFANDQKFVGDLDEFSLFNFALTDEQVQLHYDVGVGNIERVPEPASIALWSLLALLGAGFALRRRCRRMAA